MRQTTAGRGRGSARRCAGAELSALQLEVLGAAAGRARAELGAELGGCWGDALPLLAAAEWGAGRAALLTPRPQSTATAVQAWMQARAPGGRPLQRLLALEVYARPPGIKGASADKLCARDERDARATLRQPHCAHVRPSQCTGKEAGQQETRARAEECAYARRLRSCAKQHQRAGARPAATRRTRRRRARRAARAPRCARTTPCNAG